MPVVPDPCIGPSDGSAAVGTEVLCVWRRGNSEADCSVRFESCRGHYLTSADICPCEIRATRLSVTDTCRRSSDRSGCGCCFYGRHLQLFWLNPSIAHRPLHRSFLKERGRSRPRLRLLLLVLELPSPGWARRSRRWGQGSGGVISSYPGAALLKACTAGNIL
jgi:hypothetical protein